MNWFERILVFVPAVFAIMVVYSAPLAPDARGVARIAWHKSLRVLWWTLVLVVGMWLVEWLFLP